MAKETHTIELTWEELAKIVKAEFTISGKFDTHYVLVRDTYTDEPYQVISFEFEQEERELPF